MINTPDIYIKSILNGDERAYSLLFRIFAQDHDELKLKVARFLAKQVRELDYFSIIRIDQQMRQAIEVSWLIDWHSIPIERFFCKQMTEDERRAVLVFASFHPSGFVREAATRAISHYQGTLPYIILRLNDWVSTVRHAAKISFSLRIASPVFGELSQAFPFVIKLEKGMRDNHHAAVDTLCSLLMAPEHEQELNIILESQYCIVRRVCVKTLCRDVQHNIKIIKNHFLKETDPFIKLFILEKLLLAEHTWQPELLEILAKDKYYKIRLFYLKIKRQNENKESQFEPYLLDSNTHVRRLTRQMIGSLNACYDFQHFYLQHLDGTQQAAAMIGFAEVSQQKDCAVLEPYLETKDARVLCALIKALMSLNFEYYEHKMVEYLNDSRHCVVNKTFNILLTTKYHSVNQKIREIFFITTDPYVRYKCALLLFKTSGWDRLIYILESLQIDDPKVENLALMKAERWQFNLGRSFFIAPTADQITSIKNLLIKHKDIFGEHLLKNCSYF